MTTSGLTTFGVTGRDIITEALESLGVLGVGQTLDDATESTCARTLEMMIKSWSAMDIGIWKNKEVALFLSNGGHQYEIGLSGDHATAAFVKTEVAAAAAVGESSLVVDDITGISSGDYIGIELDDGSLQWTTVNGAPALSTIALTAALTDSVAIDNHVYTYTSKIPKPKSISNARLHRSDDSEVPVEIVTRQEYLSLSNKTSAGTPNQICFDDQGGSALLYVWPACDDVKTYLTMTARLPLEDLDERTNDLDFPQEWFLPVATNLAILIAPKFGVRVPDELKQTAIFYMDEMRTRDQEFLSVRFGVSKR